MLKINLAAAVIVLLFGVYSVSYSKERASSDFLRVLDEADKYNKTMVYFPPPPFKIYNVGSQEWIDYSKYGEFKGLGSQNYKYEIKDMEGLKKASGEGIYPDSQSVLQSPDFKQFLKEKKLKGEKWDFIDSSDYQANFYKWASIENEDPGLKLYYTALALEKSGNIKHAIKAYYACLVFFPKTVGYTQWKTPWYVAPVCLAKIKYLTNSHREIGVKLSDASIYIENVFDNNVTNDVFIVNPGRLIAALPKDFETKYVDLKKLPVVKVSGSGKVKLTEYEGKRFSLSVNGKPYMIKGVSYSPSKVGLSPDFGTLDNLRDWSFDDYDSNGKIDSPYDAWVDANRNEKKDRYEYRFGDFALMKEMGVNTLRIYHYSQLNKELLKDGYENYGFMYLIGNLIGMYAKDSGANWYAGTDYTDKQQLENMLESVRDMVEEYKNEPYVLMWVLGNENNYGSVSDGATAGSGCLAQLQPEAYYKFVNECAKLIKKLDPKKRPVAVSNGDLYMLDYCSKYAPDIDVYGANVYRGDYGMGQLWQDVSRQYGKPVIITEYGCPAYAKGWSQARIEEGQALYHKNNWTDIENNSAAVDGGAGNSLGGVIFEWTDEWWKAGYNYDAYSHDKDSQWKGPFLDGYAYEEWFGITSQGDGEKSPYKRQLRKAYFTYRELWNK